MDPVVTGPVIKHAVTRITMGVFRAFFLAAAASLGWHVVKAVVPTSTDEAADRIDETAEKFSALVDEFRDMMSRKSSLDDGEDS